jgi:glycerate-2-kinase
MIAIKNKEQLIQNGATQLNQKARTLALKSLESAVNAVDPKQIIRSKLSLKNSTLHVEEYSFDLKRFKNVYVIGGGKASGSMAESLEQILGNYITNGLLNIPHGSKYKTNIMHACSYMKQAIQFQTKLALKGHVICWK